MMKFLLPFLLLFGISLTFTTKADPFASLLENSAFQKGIPAHLKIPINSFISSFSKEEQFLKSGLLCSGCKALVSLINQIPGESLLSFIETVIIKICSLSLQNQEVCAGTVTEMAPYVLDSLKSRYLGSSFICGDALKICPADYVYLDSKDYVNEVIKGKPNQTYPYPSLNQVNKTYKILHLSDAHVDIEYEVGSNANCDEPICCEYHSGAAPNSSSSAQFWGTDSKCDLPYRTFEAFAKFARKYIDNDIIIWTGDNMAHDLWHQNATRNLNSSVLLTETLKRYFPNIPVFPVIGNHEPYPVNVYDFKNGNNKDLIDGLADAWNDWLGADAISTFKQNGFYSYYIAEKNLKIIGLHTQACNNQNWYFFADPTDPGNSLAWLQKELQSSEDLNETVYILGHIGAGMSECLPEWSIRYKALVDRYSYIIRATFMGHEHSEDFRVSKSVIDNSTIGLSFIPGSLTTYSYLYPEFRVYEVDAETNIPINYYQYRLNLSKYNELGNTTEEIIFDNVYNFTDQYNVPDMSFQSFDKVMESLKTDINIVKKFIFNKGQGSPYAQEQAEKADLDTGASEYCNRFNTVQDVEDCNGSSPDVENLLIRYLTGKWRNSTN